MANSTIQICFLIFGASLYICHGFFCLPKEHVALFIFGDSGCDVGNNNSINTTTDFQANSWPYGNTSFKYPSGRPSDGLLIPDFIAEYAKLSFIPPYLQHGFHQYFDGANFASAGGGAFVETNKGFEIYKKGGRKFGFLNLPPLGCLPVIKALIPPAKDGCIEKVTEVVKLHNEAFSEALHELGAQLGGFKYSYIDFYTSISERIKSPSKYGFKESNMGCCGGGPYRGWQSCGGKRTVKEFEVCNDWGDYLIFDAAHPTEKAYHQIAELMWNKDHKVAKPYNLKELYEL